MKAKVPDIVASFSLLNQQSTFGDTPVFTPTVDGLFRVSLYLDFEPGNINNTTANSVNINFTYTDDFSNLNIPTPKSANNSVSGAYAAAEFVKLVAGQPVLISILGFGTTPTTYNLYIIVEDLN